MIRSDTVHRGPSAALAAGYVLWLVAFSIADDNAAVGRWAPTVLLLSAVLAIGAVLWGRCCAGAGNTLVGVRVRPAGSAACC